MAGDGGANIITVPPALVGYAQVIDNAGIVAGPGCTDVGSGNAICPLPGGERVKLALDAGGGDDTIYLAAGAISTATIDAGDGDDAVDVFQSPGSAQATRIDGGAGDDVLSGGDECDVFVAGPGADVMRGGADTPCNTVDYSGRDVPLSVTFDGVANDGARGEGDDVGGDGGHIGVVLGGSDRDRLDASMLSGDAAARRLDGGGGDDVLTGGGGRDFLLGAAGDDHLIGVGDAAGDALDCGEGRDRATADELDVLTRCEATTIVPVHGTDAATPPPVLPPPVLPPVADHTPAGIAFVGLRSTLAHATFARSGLTVRVRTSEAAGLAAELRGRVTLRRGRLAFAARASDLVLTTARAGQGSGTRTLRLTPSARLRAALSRHPGARVTVVVTATDAAGNASAARRTVRLR